MLGFLRVLRLIRSNKIFQFSLIKSIKNTVYNRGDGVIVVYISDGFIINRA